MTRQRAIRSLFVLWVGGASLATLLVSLQIIGGHYGPDGDSALSWLLVQYTPALSILLAAAFSEPSKRWRETVANQWRFRWSLAISCVQIAIMLSVILALPMFEQSGINYSVVFKDTQAMLAILQGIAVAAIGSVIFEGR